MTRQELGEKALSLILEIEEGRVEPCPVCGSCDFTEYTHSEDCEWLKILDAADET